MFKFFRKVKSVRKVSRVRRGFQPGVSRLESIVSLSSFGVFAPAPSTDTPYVATR